MWLRNNRVEQDFADVFRSNGRLNPEDLTQAVLVAIGTGRRYSPEDASPGAAKLIQSERQRVPESDALRTDDTRNSKLLTWTTPRISSNFQGDCSTTSDGGEMSSESEDDDTPEDMSEYSSTAEDSPLEDSPSPCEGLAGPVSERTTTSSRDATSALASAGHTSVAAETAEETARYVPAHSFPMLRYNTPYELPNDVQVPVEEYRPVLVAAQDVCAKMPGWPIRELVVVEVLAMFNWEFNLSKHVFVGVVVDRLVSLKCLCDNRSWRKHAVLE
jgi:hypothetical protein